jgi:general secretion pathway protein B
MSLILDALRKSERTRQQSLTGQLGAGETPPPPARLTLPWTTLLGILLLVNAVVLGLFFWRSDRETAAPQAATAGAVQPQAAPYRPEVRPLSGEAPAAAVQSDAARVTVAPAATAAAASAVQAVIAQNGSADLPSYDSLPQELKQSLPPLHLDVHGYAAEPAQRFVVINLQRYRVGDTVAGNLRVVDIVPQGVILESNGTRFLLPP